MSQRSDDTSKGGCCFPALFADKATRADVKRAFYRISQLEKKIDQITKQQEKLRTGKTSSKVSKRNQKYVIEEKERQKGSGVIIHAAESVYVKRTPDAPAVITLPCGCVLEKRTLHSTSEEECNDKNVPRSLSTCGCGLVECKIDPSVSEQKCRVNFVDNSHSQIIVQKHSGHSHKGVINNTPEEHSPSDCVPLKTIRSCVCGHSNSPQTVGSGGSLSSENCLKSTHTTSTQTCRGHPPQISDDSEMSMGKDKCVGMDGQVKRTVVCRTRKSKLALGRFKDSRYKLPQTHVCRTPTNDECEEVSSGVLSMSTPQKYKIDKLRSNQLPFKRNHFSKKVPWGSMSKTRTDKKNKKQFTIFEPFKKTQPRDITGMLSSKSSSDAILSSSHERRFNKRKRKKRIKAFVLPAEK